jgi:hypothetical protein
MTTTATLADSDWTISEQAAEYEANGETPERARELAETQEAYLINHSYDALPRGWRYAGDGTWTGPAVVDLNIGRLLDIIGALQIEACDFAVSGV